MHALLDLSALLFVLGAHSGAITMSHYHTQTACCVAQQQNSACSSVLPFVHALMHSPRKAFQLAKIR